MDSSGFVCRQTTREDAQLVQTSATRYRQLRKSKGWYWRLKQRLLDESYMWKDVSRLSKDLEAFATDTVAHPELKLTARVRRSNELCQEERDYLHNRRARMAVSLRSYLGLDYDVDPEDVPIVSLAGSGGGFRASLGFCAVFQAAQDSGLWDLLAYVAGVSGSCWSIAAYYTWAQGDVTKCLKHFALHSKHHPLSPHAMHSVLRGENGALKTIGQLKLKRKAGSTCARLSIPPHMILTDRVHLMDVYGVFMSAWLWLPSIQEVEDEGMAEEDIDKLRGTNPKWLKYTTSMQLIGEGAEQPLPILTAIRHQVPWATKSKSKKGQKPSSTQKPYYQWTEFTPLEVGLDEAEAWVPTWAFGRKFEEGLSVQALPEISLGILLGFCTAAPAAPLYQYVDTIRRALPSSGAAKSVQRGADKTTKKIFGGTGLKRLANKSVFTAAEAWNHCHIPTSAGQTGKESVEESKTLQFLDSGLDNNTPMYPFAHPGRDVDLVIVFDASSDVQNDTFLTRLHEFGDKKGLRFEKAKVNADEVPLNQDHIPTGGHAIAKKFEGRYAQVFEGTPLASPLPDMTCPPAPRKLTQVYCPLLPSALYPDYDPSKAKFSGSYNLVWKDSQVATIAKTARADFQQASAIIKECIHLMATYRRFSRLHSLYRTQSAFYASCISASSTTSRASRSLSVAPVLAIFLAATVYHQNRSLLYTEDLVQQKEPSTGIEFPESLHPKNASSPLQLIGLGLRTVSFLSIRVYVAAFYMSPEAAHYVRSKSVERTTLLSKDSHKFWADLISQPFEFAIQIEPTRQTNFTHWRDSFVRSMTTRLAAASKDLSDAQTEEVAQAIGQLKGVFPNSSAPKGKALTLLRKNNGSLAIEYDGNTLGTLDNRFIADGLILSYFSRENIISAKLHESVADRLSTL